MRYRAGIILLLVFVAVISFLLGSFSRAKRGGDEIVFSCDPTVLQTLAIPKDSTNQPLVAQASIATAGQYFASKNGERFYPATCASAQKRIKPENLIWFESTEEATLQGFTRGSSC